MPRRPRAGQTVLELVMALIATLVLCAGIISIWSWLVGNIVGRQVAYERSRCVAGTGPNLKCGPKVGEPGKLDYFTPTRPDVLGEGPAAGPGGNPPGGNPPGGNPPGGNPPGGNPPGCTPDAGIFSACTRACLRCSDPNGLQCRACFGSFGCCTVGTDIDAFCRKVGGCP